MRSQNYPDTIPPDYAENETLSDAYRRGWNHGHGIACNNVPKLGEKLLIVSLGYGVTVDKDNVREIHEALCHEEKSNATDHTHTKFLLHQVLTLEAPGPTEDEVWAAFEKGGSDSIAADLATYTDEDYGIKPPPTICPT